LNVFPRLYNRKFHSSPIFRGNRANHLSLMMEVMWQGHTSPWTHFTAV